MALFQIMAPRQGDNVCRTMQWRGTARAGDDLKFAFTLLENDGETVADVTQANARMMLVESGRDNWDWDYGWVHLAPLPIMTLAGWVFNGPLGRVNFFIPSASSLGLWPHRYGFVVEVDQPDGITTQMMGLLQVTPSYGSSLGNASRSYLRIGATNIGGGIVPPGVFNNQAADAFGFPLAASVPQQVYGLTDPTAPAGVSQPSEGGATAIPGLAIPGQMILGTT